MKIKIAVITALLVSSLFSQFAMAYKMYKYTDKDGNELFTRTPLPKGKPPKTDENGEDLSRYTKLESVIEYEEVAKPKKATSSKALKSAQKMNASYLKDTCWFGAGDEKIMECRGYVLAVYDTYKAINIAGKKEIIFCPTNHVALASSITPFWPTATEDQKKSSTVEYVYSILGEFAEKCANLPKEEALGRNLLVKSENLFYACSSNDYLDNIFCLSYVHGVTDAVNAFYSSRKTKKQYCTPKSLDDFISKYINTVKTVESSGATDSVINTLDKHYICQ